MVFVVAGGRGQAGEARTGHAAQGGRESSNCPEKGGIGPNKRFSVASAEDLGGSERGVNRACQKGCTMTMMTITTINTAGISFTIR